MTAFSVKNWDQFQHYKTGKNAARRPEWIRLYTRLLDDIEFHELSGDDSKALIMLWALASEKDGELPSVKAMAFRLRLTEQKLTQILGRLSHWIEANPSEILGQIREEKEEIREEQEKKRERRAQARKLPPDWKPSQTHCSEGQELGFSPTQVEGMAKDMRLWAEAKGETKKNWNAAFSGWMRREQKRAPPHALPKTRTELAYERLQQRIAANGNGGFGLCGEGGEVPVGQLPKPSPRTGSVPDATRDPVHRKVEILAPGDDAPGDWSGVRMPVPHRRSG